MEEKRGEKIKQHTGACEQFSGGKSPTNSIDAKTVVSDQSLREGGNAKANATARRENETTPNKADTGVGVHMYARFLSEVMTTLWESGVSKRANE